MIKAVFFDIDDTLLDFNAYVRETMRLGFAKFGLPPYEEAMYGVFERVNGLLWREIENGTLTYEELYRTRWDKVFAALGMSCDGPEFEAYFRSRLHDNAIHIEGALDILRYLSGKYILCAASNGPYEQQVNRLRVGGMLEFFAHVFISEKIGFSKPAPEFFDRCLAELNAGRGAAILPAEIMMVGDSLTSDMAGGIDSGLHTCYLDRSGRGGTRGLKVDYVINRLCEIRDFL